MSFTRMSFKTVFLLCLVVTFVPVHCEKKESDDEKTAKLPEFLSELDLASLEASEEDIADLKKVVKRLAPEKNGVTGQPGVDFPVLTTIPTTSFTCRGVKGGYYADLETNCQVFHICDQGRKISFLCPNGTIFQQSQLICDWWFKVDCSKSAELYEQSAELLAEEERKRSDAKKINSEYHRNSEEDNGQNFQYVDYDGRQNGRSNPFGQSASQNQIQDNKHSKNNQAVGQDYNQAGGRQGNQYSQNYKQKDLQDLSEGNTNYNQQQQSTVLPGNNQPRHRQQNQLIDDRKEKTKQLNDVYDQRNARKFQTADHAQGKSEKQNFRTSKSRTLSDNNRNPAITQKVTPTYTETTTFRTTSPNPVKEVQQLAESSAFATNRGNRYNHVFGSTQYNTFFNNRISSSDNLQKSSTPAYSLTTNETSGPTSLRPKIGSIPPFPGPTFTPIFKPRLTALTNRGTITSTTSKPFSFSQSATSSFVYNNKNAQNYKQLSSSSTSSNDRYKPNQSTQRTYVNTDYYRQNTTPAVTSTTYDSTPNYYDNTVTGNYKDETYTTSRPFTATESYRENTATMTTVTDFTGNTFPETVTPSPTTFINQNQRFTNQNQGYTNQNQGFTNQNPEFTNQNQGFENKNQGFTNQNQGVTNKNQGFTSSKSNRDREDRQRNDNQFSTKSPSRTSQVYQLNSIITASTEKPFNQNSITKKPLTSYDTTFNNRQGKSGSTVRPYVPFTKNYAYTTAGTTSTQKPIVYTATIPSYTPANFIYRETSNDLIPKTKSPIYSTSFSSSRSGTGATYLPKQTTAKVSPVTKKPILEARPPVEREHAFSMMQSLQGLEGTIPELETLQNGNRTGLNIPSSSGPSTLHSLALYFATASENYDLGNATDSSLDLPAKGNVSVDLPTSILTQHTINSYVNLFNLNNALENNTAFLLEDNSAEINTSDDFDDDLDLQQSEGPLNGAKKSNSTKLRELAQVFTHALSAYLQDPETFKKVLTEIRPTEPPPSSEEESGENTSSPTTTEEYPSVTKEKDEVLDFSDDTIGARRRRPTTPFPNQSTNPITESTDYYTTPLTYSESQYSTTTPSTQGNEADSSNQERENNFAFEVNHALQENKNFNSGLNLPSNSLNDYENYFPAKPRQLSFQNKTREPYGKHVKPFDATPINNYVSSSTPASYFQSNEQVVYGQSKEPVQILQQELAPPAFQNSKNQDQNIAYDTNFNQNSISSTTEPFRIRYYDTSTKQKNDESLVTASSIHPNYKNEFFNLNNKLPTGRSNSLFNTNEPPRPVYSTHSDQSNDHWTASPEVTRLWETTVFLDPQRINNDLILDPNVSTTGPRLADPTQFNTNSNEHLATDSSGVTPPNFISDSSTPWQRAPNNNDSPTVFSLLPSTYFTENTVTPNPTFTTSSSITTTITSSVTSTSGALQETLVPNSVINVTENEVEKAQEMFGKLNATSTSTLMKVMKQADNNATVRQLVLLLISHCKGPMNKTMEEEKEQLLSALLRLPVNEFTTEESHEIIAGISKLNLPIGTIRFHSGSEETKNTQPSSTATEPSITTFRSRHGRKFKSTTSLPETNYQSLNLATAETRNALVEDESSISDNRALELLRSLYSIAAKWG
ncbi:mucin-5AC isoform X2 [Belonocnema kinseyi]|uniref:mucin-5AC isoform X2 n=1 Tax=Belonocnema kinseyi TaxID=2817044 RepID=UPI00143DD330|nr:mucin-5AC isoform X2 [Belonocnema kinseyi]